MCDSDGVKDVRLGMDGQTTPTTRIVVDLTRRAVTNWCRAATTRWS